MQYRGSIQKNTNFVNDLGKKDSKHGWIWKHTLECTLEENNG